MGQANNQNTRTRRGHGEGTARYNEERNRWEARFSYTDPVTGKFKRKMFTANSRPKAMAKGREFVKNLNDGLLPNADKLTLGEWIDQWLQNYAKSNVRTKTYEKYESTLKCYILPRLGKIKMNKLQAVDIQKILNELLISGGMEEQGISSSTVRATRQYLSMALNKAVQLGLLHKNPVKVTQPPRLEKEEIHPLTECQSNHLLEVAQEGQYVYYGVKQRHKKSPPTKYMISMAHIAVLTALNTGMRLGEVFGLQWSDIDLENNVILIQRSLVSTSTKGMIFELPKTKRSKRKVRINQLLKASLEQYKNHQESYASDLGDKFNNERGLVFPNSFGKPIDTSNFITRYFKRMTGYAGLDEGFSFHDLRHTHATLLLKKGVNIKVISERLGHSSITMTLDTYAHLMPDMQDTAVEALDILFTVDNKQSSSANAGDQNGDQNGEELM